MNLDKLAEGVLCKLSIGRWDASSKLPKDKLGRDLPKEIVRAMQDLVEDKTLLKDLSTIRRTAKGLLQRNSLDHPIEGLHFVPRETITHLDEEFAKLQKENNERLEKLIAALPKLKAGMKEKYPKFYRAEKYPDAAALREKYYFKWQFFHIHAPDPEAGILSPAVYKREQDKFRDMVEQMEEMAVNLIANRLLKRIKSLNEQCTSGKVNAGTYASVERFLGGWEQLWEGYVDQKKLRMVFARLRKATKSVDYEDLKDSDAIRQTLSKELDKAVTNIRNIPDVRLKPKLDI